MHSIRTARLLAGGLDYGIDAIREYLQTKSVWIDIAGNAPNPFVLR